ncbi:type I methionyl aminopeptidase [Patescibacteria group bacterium]|nr:type I methionyl aminopeptidase [Patescibacteria group bacterium]MBU1721594.1 type I methionyl aminopeptidase [Patescibacteria group bacterium]MBU1901820.1 type I methionyl aminopeptidase [Patescibacteria group bacterium]
MGFIKDKQAIDRLIEGGKILGEILETISEMVMPGANAFDIDAEAERLILAAGGRPAFKGYRSSRRDPKFPSTICASLNEEIVHGIATKDKVFKEGDIFSIDIGMQWPVNSGEGRQGNGFFTDTAITVAVGSISPKAQALMDATKASLELAIDQVQIGRAISDIGKVVENYIHPKGYGIVRDLVGHGVGYAVHEEPRIPNYYEPELDTWKIEHGAVLAIEPMITEGKYHITVADDGWSISTVDKKLSAHFEHTIIATEDGPLVVTRRPKELAQMS